MTFPESLQILSLLRKYGVITSRSITFELFKACIGIISAEQSEVEEYIVDVEEVCQINSTVVNCTEEGAQFDYWVSTNKAS